MAANVRNLRFARMDASIEDYASRTELNTSCTAAFNRAIKEIHTDNIGGRRLYFPANNYKFLTAPDPIRRVFIKGDGPGGTVFERHFTGAANMFNFDGAGGFTSGGMEDCSIMNMTSAQNGVAIYLLGDSSVQPDDTVFRNIYITCTAGTGLWNYCMVISGQNRTSPQGIRVGIFENIQMFCALFETLYIYNAVQMSFNNIGCYGGNGAGAASAAINLSGSAGVTNLQNAQLKFTNCVATELFAVYGRYCYFQGLFDNITTSVEAPYCRFEGWKNNALIGSLGTGSVDNTVQY